MIDIVYFLYQTEKPYYKTTALYLLSDPRSRLADLKRTGSYRTKAGEVKAWTANTHQLVLPPLCSEMLGELSSPVTPTHSFGLGKSWVKKQFQAISEIPHTTHHLNLFFSVPCGQI